MALVGMLSMMILAAAPFDAGQKLLRVIALEDHGAIHPDDMAPFLRDSEASVRRRAAMAAGRLAEPATAPMLAPLLNDSEPEVRQMAAFSLGLIGDQSATPALVAALGDSDALVRARAVEALGRIGGGATAERVVQMVARALPKKAPFITVRGDDPGSVRDPWLELRLGLFALARLRSPAAAEAVLLQGGKSRFDWWAATYLASEIQSNNLKPFLLQAARSTDPLSRIYAARSLGRYRDAQAVEALAALMRDPQPSVTIHAIRALGDTRLAEATTVIGQAFGALKDDQKCEALRALCRLPPRPALREGIVACIGSKDPSMRAAALQALAHTVPDEFALVFATLDPDPVWFVRSSLAQAFGELSEEIGLGLLYGMLKDSDSRVVPQALSVLMIKRRADAKETLMKALNHNDGVVRAEAAEGLTALKAQGSLPALAQAYARSKNDVDWGGRHAIVQAIKMQSGAPGRDVLQAIAMDDPAEAIRREAQKALGAGENVQRRRRSMAALAMFDYREAMTSYVPFAGEPTYTPRLFFHTARGAFEIHLNVVDAPLTCARFIALAKRGYFNQLEFYRLDPGVVLEWGCPRGDGRGGLGYGTRREFSQRPFGRGAVGVSYSGDESGDARLFTTLIPAPALDGQRCLLGWIVNGWDVIEKLRAGDEIGRVEVWDNR